MEHSHHCCLPPTSQFTTLTIVSTKNSILKSLISESSPAGGSPSYKYAVNSTIIQHLVPTSALNRAKATQESSIAKTETSDVKNEATGIDGKPHVGRRGMHSATGAYWNEKTDGMWSFKYEGGENKGLDVVISVICKFLRRLTSPYLASFTMVYTEVIDFRVCAWV
jgi:hypothetical protein